MPVPGGLPERPDIKVYVEKVENGDEKPQDETEDMLYLRPSRVKVWKVRAQHARECPADPHPDRIQVIEPAPAQDVIRPGERTKCNKTREHVHLPRGHLGSMVLCILNPIAVGCHV